MEQLIGSGGGVPSCAGSAGERIAFVGERAIAALRPHASLACIDDLAELAAADQAHAEALAGELLACGAAERWVRAAGTDPWRLLQALALVRQLAPDAHGRWWAQAASAFTAAGFKALVVQLGRWVAAPAAAPGGARALAQLAGPLRRVMAAMADSHRCSLARRSGCGRCGSSSGTVALLCACVLLGCSELRGALALLLERQGPGVAGVQELLRAVLLALDICGRESSAGEGAFCSCCCSSCSSCRLAQVQAFRHDPVLGAVVTLAVQQQQQQQPGNEAPLEQQPRLQLLLQLLDQLELPQLPAGLLAGAESTVEVLLREAIRLGPDQTGQVALLWRCLVKLAEQLYGAGVDWEAGAAVLPHLPAFLEHWAGHLVKAGAAARWDLPVLQRTAARKCLLLALMLKETLQLSGRQPTQGQRQQTLRAPACSSMSSRQCGATLHDGEDGEAGSCGQQQQQQQQALSFRAVQAMQLPQLAQQLRPACGSVTSSSPLDLLQQAELGGLCLRLMAEPLLATCHGHVPAAAEAYGAALAAQCELLLAAVRSSQQGADEGAQGPHQDQRLGSCAGLGTSLVGLLWALLSGGRSKALRHLLQMGAIRQLAEFVAATGGCRQLWYSHFGAVRCLQLALQLAESGAGRSWALQLQEECCNPRVVPHLLALLWWQPPPGGLPQSDLQQARLSTLQMVQGLVQQGLCGELLLREPRVWQYIKRALLEGRSHAGHRAAVASIDALAATDLATSLACRGCKLGGGPDEAAGGAVDVPPGARLQLGTGEGHTGSQLQGPRAAADPQQQAWDRRRQQVQLAQKLAEAATGGRPECLRCCGRRGSGGRSVRAQPGGSCAYCGACREAVGLFKVCMGCGAARYCDADCQRAHWRVHKYECGRGAGGAGCSVAQLEADRA